MSPLVSIIMPVRNGSNYLAEALKAIKSQNIDLEIILVDDSSTDDTVQIARNFGCVVLQHSISKGPVVAKNSGLKIARGKYFMFHDHDDVMNEGSLALMLQEMQANDELFAVIAQLKDFISPELSQEESKKLIIRSDSYSGLFSGAILMKREIFDVVGLFDESIKAGEIIDWQSRINLHNLPTKKIEHVSSNRRIHNSNFGKNNKSSEYKDYASILRSKLKRF